ncbi:hypothetical protein [Gordonia jacobaea]|uniref:hypothetical protein n=1 Tax=Gordonia jacobaea TaxID=122202 RepID=UPI003D73FF74
MATGLANDIATTTSEAQIAELLDTTRELIGATETDAIMAAVITRLAEHLWVLPLEVRMSGVNHFSRDSRCTVLDPGSLR